MDLRELSWTEAGELTVDHPFRTQIGESRARGDASSLLAAIGARYRVDVHASVARYVESTLRCGRARGPLRIVGVADALANPMPNARVFGKFDGLFPAIDVGGDRSGTTFWTCLGSGRVITLHHDATFYERAARATVETADGSFSNFERSSVVDLDGILALQAELFATFGDETPDRALYARVVLDVLGLTPANARRLVETDAFEFLGLGAEDLDDLPKKGARTLAPAKGPQQKKAAAAHPRVLLHLEQNGRDATSIDLSHLRLERLPSELLDLSSLERIDLSGNPKLDFEKVFEQLTALPALREVRFDDCAIKGLPASFAKLASIDAVDLTGHGHHKTANFFESSAALEVVAKLPRLRTLTLKGGFDRGRRARDLLSSAAFADLEDLTLSNEVLGADVGPALAGKHRLRRLALDGCPLGPDALANLGSLVELELHRIGQIGALPSGVRKLALREIQALPPDAVANLPALEDLVLEAKTIGDELPMVHPAAPLQKLYVNGELARWGPMRERFGDLSSFTASLTGASRPEALDSAAFDRIRSLWVGGVAIDLTKPLGAIEVLRAFFDGRPPEWMAGSETLRQIDLVDLDLATRAFELALAAPRLEAISGGLGLWSTPFEVPDTFASAKHLTKFDVYGSFADAQRAYERIARAPALEELSIQRVDLAELPRALGDLPLRRFEYSAPSRGKGAHLDLAAAFAVLAKTPLRDLSLGYVERIPPEIELLSGLESLRISGLMPPTFPATMSSLRRLRSLECHSAKIVGPMRKNLEKALPACSITTALW